MKITVADVMDEFGTALIADPDRVAVFDITDPMSVLSDAVRENGNAGLRVKQVEQLREALGLCRYGLEHWVSHCHEEDDLIPTCEEVAATESFYTPEEEYAIFI